MLSPLKLCFCAQASREMTFEGKECVKEVGLHCFFLTQLCRYPSFLKSVIKHVQKKKKKKKNLVSVGLLGNKNSKMHEENHINLSLNNSSQPLATISSHRALSKTNFAILFSLKRKRQFKKKTQSLRLNSCFHTTQETRSFHTLFTFFLPWIS